jgi:hypothetical protein
MPSKNAIKAAWSFYLIEIGKFDSHTEFWEPAEKSWRDDPEFKYKDYCWGCGMTEEVERAHILAHTLGGSSGVENLNLLCGECHRSSEMLHGAEYLDWLSNRKFVHRMLERVGKSQHGGFTNVLTKEATA